MFHKVSCFLVNGKYGTKIYFIDCEFETHMVTRGI